MPLVPLRQSSIDRPAWTCKHHQQSPAHALQRAVWTAGDVTGRPVLNGERGCCCVMFVPLSHCTLTIVFLQPRGARAMIFKRTNNTHNSVR